MSDGMTDDDGPWQRRPGTGTGLGIMNVINALRAQGESEQGQGIHERMQHSTFDMKKRGRQRVPFLSASSALHGGEVGREGFPKRDFVL